MEKTSQWILLWVSLLIYSLGFFQLGPVFSNSVSIPILSEATAIVAPFDRMVFMVIDALRADFVYSSRFNGFQFLSTHANSRSVVALAKTPTVTLPRLKALTGGTAPRFLDLLNNFGTRAGHWGDSWVQQAHLAGKQVCHYGDDTWLRLFPGLLNSKSEGVHSFFVTDTVEVDRNVTCHLKNTLQEKEWDILTLHYLGLDHVGHIGGVSSPLLIPKMQEMDAIAKTIYESLDERTLLVVLGDHGMTDSGNHGGSSPAECETACLFLSKQYTPGNGNQRRVAQVDVAPTISLLLGLPIPVGSTGTLIAEAVPSPDSLMTLLQRNALQLGTLAQKQPNCSTVKECEQWCQMVSSELGGQKDEYNLHLIASALLLILVAMCMPIHLMDYFCAFAILGGGFVILTSLEYLLPPILLVILLYVVYKNPPHPKLDLNIIVYLLYGASMFSSTFIEEEHEFWYFIHASTILWALYTEKMKLTSALVQLFAMRGLRYWNATGYLSRDAMDMRIFLANHPNLLKFLHTAVVIGLLLKIAIATNRVFSAKKPSRSSGGKFAHLFKRFSMEISTGLYARIGTIAPIGASILILPPLIYAVKFMETSIMVQRAAIVATLLTTISRQWRLSLALLFVLYLKPHNALPLFIIVLLPSTLPVRHASFFALGACHLVASLDFSPAYLGQTHYTLLIAPLAFAVLWAGPILSARPGNYWIWRAISLFTVLFSVALQRHHISVWTVFAPRILFEYGWLLFYTLLHLFYAIVMDNV